jgi:hypothetical protein
MKDYFYHEIWSIDEIRNKAVIKHGLYYFDHLKNRTCPVLFADTKEALIEAAEKQFGVSLIAKREETLREALSPENRKLLDDTIKALSSNND